MKNQAFKYFMHDGPTAFQFELAGELDHEGAARLNQDWQTASSVIGERRLNIDITFVTSVDEQGKELLARWHREGARIIANSKTSRALAESILGESAGPEENVVVAATDRTWIPFHTWFPAPALNLLLVFAALLFPASANAATLRPDTAAAWDDYVRTAEAAFQNRVRPGGTFLWTFENSERAAKVRSGEIIVTPATRENPKKVPGGLIHHWVGAAFLPGANLNDALEVTRDYDRYKEFYRPSVIDSTTIARNGTDDKFSMLLMNRVLFSKMALDADYQAKNVRVNDHRFYRISRTTRVQEVEEYGQPGEHKIPEGEGGGFVWKLYSIARFEQRDEGVYIELEAMALSRDIPGAVRLIAAPIVRRVSRNALLTSLQQTGEAVRGVILVAGHVGVSSPAGQMRGTRAELASKRSAFTTVH